MRNNSLGSAVAKKAIGQMAFLWQNTSIFFDMT